MAQRKNPSLSEVADNIKIEDADDVSYPIVLNTEKNIFHKLLERIEPNWAEYRVGKFYTRFGPFPLASFPGDDSLGLQLKETSTGEYYFVTPPVDELPPNQSESFKKIFADKNSRFTYQFFYLIHLPLLLYCGINVSKMRPLDVHEIFPLEHPDEEKRKMTRIDPSNLGLVFVYSRIQKKSKVKPGSSDEDNKVVFYYPTCYSYFVREGETSGRINYFTFNKTKLMVLIFEKLFQSTVKSQSDKYDRYTIDEKFFKNEIEHKDALIEKAKRIRNYDFQFTGNALKSMKKVKEVIMGDEDYDNAYKIFLETSKAKSEYGVGDPVYCSISHELFPTLEKARDLTIYHVLFNFDKMGDHRLRSIQEEISKRERSSPSDDPTDDSTPAGKMSRKKHSYLGQLNLHVPPEAETGEYPGVGRAFADSGNPPPKKRKTK